MYVEFDCGTVLPCKNIQEWIDEQLAQKSWVVTDLQLDNVELATDGSFSPYQGKQITFKCTHENGSDYLFINVETKNWYQ
ncbi:hypothetical protein IW147_005317 [Coemansia sp. RSA 720]|nr:hypothetical protein IW147_005317 [Coemansia sp. RSA 720]